MKKELVQTRPNTLKGHKQQIKTGVACWLARDFEHLLGYTKWENFLNVVSKAKTFFEVSGNDVGNHFPGVRKIVVAATP